MGRKLERGTSDSVGKDSTRAPGRQSTRGGSIERGTSDGRSFGSKSSIRERVLRMKSFNASNRQFSKLRDSRWNTVKRKFRRFAKIVTRARDKLFEWDKSGQKKHVKAAEETLDTYHESYLYGHVPFTIRLRAALRVGRVGNTLAVVEFVLALLSVGLYIRSTYTTYQPIVLPVLEAVASVYFVLDYILKLYR
ncbi:hypothetical protein CBR_g32405 [Chara braunii]|uniref:Uncharacterized protein n=1 Tax=Chara braunii TaxID=69332 RepID=A0A388JYI0_CHABU|nr:hypothetical protein CBR_g32405 [Chara braunii]|eukprot:GBG62822.1 hypothetical protein CBR_g32405 [Chara braunii]